ncbi:MAG: biotin--[acetyl-CoA-carboxylase] ligase [Myxococcota bacterium]|nr:biotin--[acetyl-CoA-carboxylase] ligase [Myxococcota bacterium]
MKQVRRLSDGRLWWSVDLCESTQDLLAAAPPEVALFTAARQHHGRGRRGRQWLSPVGGLYLSWRPDFPFGPELGHILPFLTAVALAELLGEEGLLVSLKWPNDLLVRGEKIAGILVEARSDGTGMEALVGVGLNCTQSVALTEGTSLEICGLSREPEWIAEALYERLNAALCDAAATQRPLSSVLARWRSFELPQGTRLCREGREGLYRGVDEAGALLFEGEDGLERIGSGEVALISLER